MHVHSCCHDDYQCKQFAHEQVGGVTPNQASLTSGATSAAIGAGLGAAAGALIGAGSGHAGSGAAIGAGSGLIAGGLIGTSNARVSGRIAQHRYDNNYVQCMYIVVVMTTINVNSLLMNKWAV